jgi:hypothetical protein
MYSLIVTAKLNDIDLCTWLADVLARIADNQHRHCTNSYHGTRPDPIQSLKRPDDGCTKLRVHHSPARQDAW